MVIAGGGVLGTMHAVMARRRGFEVVQLEREAEARGASVRNFGLVWVSGRKAGPELSLALRARELWAELGARVPGLGFRAAGSLTLASGDAELALLKEAAARPDADQREFELLDPAGVRAVNPALRGEFAGGCSAGPTRSSSRGRYCPRCGATSRETATSGFLAGRSPRSRRTRCAITPGPGTSATWWSCAPARRTPGWPDGTCARRGFRRSGGSGCR